MTVFVDFTELGGPRGLLCPRVVEGVKVQCVVCLLEYTTRNMADCYRHLASTEHANALQQRLDGKLNQYILSYRYRGC